MAKEILDILPKTIRDIVENAVNVDKLQEIRIKVNRPLYIYSNNKEKFFSYKTSLEEMKYILQKISNYSIYAFEDEIKQGYITIKGGHRVGLCGTVVTENNMVKTIKDIVSINIRVAREIIDCSKEILPYMLDGNNVLNTIIISPPKCGKTTILRDICRVLSTGSSNLNFTGKNITIVDERSELGACYKGVPQMNVGDRTDVLDNCPKSQGIIMAIRSMSPQIIICDEIGTSSDMESIIAALNSGVNLITTIHGFDVEDLYKRPVFKEIMENRVFKRAVVLSNKKGVGTIEYVYDFTKGEEIRGECKC
ncbi:MAG: stage III sporulation protein AA [Clostridium argentinense]|uniref:Stage III sporulation protein AA n=1 Tax=Clostridium faecium TaxID=2762223 RepID=A0ABR8YVR7_9CLOT|nr:MULTISPECIES: stage III sporulation protein AA [Clostridium]MBD8048382.1 stage III sporulation protein AA [Clostridium faecium]MBS5823221.1 stage III sporulation protein AA [Clostridium argentinense]MDU1349015.1 stage III sporulation protein AA [Clostridium argentinense]